VKPLKEACICLAHLTCVNLAGGILILSWWEFCHRFSWVWVFNSKWNCGDHTRVGHPGELLHEFHYLFLLLCVSLHVTDLWVRPTISVNALFLSGCWSLAEWKQLNVSKPFRGSAAHHSRVDEERPCASAGRQQSQFTDSFRRLHGYVYAGKLNSAGASSVSPQTTGASGNGPCTVLTSKQSPNVVWKSSGYAGLQLSPLAVKTIVSQFSW